MMPLGAVAELIGAELKGGNAENLIQGVQTLSRADATHVSFLANAKYQSDANASQAAAVITDRSVSLKSPQLFADDPYLAFARLQRSFFPDPVAQGMIHASAIISDSAQLAEDVDVGAGTVIAADVQIGAGTVIGSGVVVEKNARIGEKCFLRAQVVIGHDCVLGNRVTIHQGAIVGSDGFGYVWDGSQHLKIPQVGRVVIQDNVDIGANTCIDRGAIDDTLIRQGVKLDNLIQIAHNVQIGDFTVMASQVGISGSTNIGAGCQFGGQVGMAGHLNIGQGVKIAAKSGVMSDLENGGTFAGIPTMPHRQWLKANAILAKLPSVWKKISKWV